MTEKENRKQSPRRSPHHRPQSTAPNATPKRTVANKMTPALKKTSVVPASNKRTSRVSHRHGSGKGSGQHRGGGRPFSQRSQSPREPQKVKSSKQIQSPGSGAVRVITLGGVEEVGRNMFAIEYKDDILIFDVGFQFEEDSTPGIDYILPNTTYLEERKHKIRAVIITHGHLDHIGGIPYIMEKIGNPPLYTRNLTSLMIKKRQSEFPDAPALDINLVEPGDKRTFGSLPVEFFPVTHSIPDSMGISVKTPHGNIVVSGDLRLDHVDGEPTDFEKDTWGHIGGQDNLLFIADSTNAELPGFSIPESKIVQNLEELMGSIQGRIIIGTFASQFARMIKLIQICEKFGRKVVTEGRSIKTNIEIAREAGLLDIKKDTIIPIQEIDKYPPHKVCVLATGAQGEEFAALMRVATKKHKFITLTPRDTIILSSSVIPGNEISVQKLKDNLYRHGVKLIHYKVSDVHASGHGRIEELKWMNKQVGAQYFMPAYGFHSMLRVHAQSIIEDGFPEKNVIIADNGTITDFNKEKFVIHKDKAPSNMILVDGFSIGDVQEVVLRDRQMLAQDGMFVIVVTLDAVTGKVRKSPDLISRGFVYLRESQELLKNTRTLVKKTVEKTVSGMKPINFDMIKNQLTDDVSRYLFKKTNKRPIVIPVILGL